MDHLHPWSIQHRFKLTVWKNSPRSTFQSTSSAMAVQKLVKLAFSEKLVQNNRTTSIDALHKKLKVSHAAESTDEITVTKVLLPLN
jgi:hypothetical protein